MHFPQIHGGPLSHASQCHLSQRERLWQAGSLSTGRLRLDRTQKGGPCLRGQRLLDNAPCQAVAGLDSGALPFPRHRASLVQTKADRHANGSPFGATATTAASGGNREELLGQRPAGCERQRSRRWEPQPGLGEELATRLRGLGRCQTALRRDSIALIKSLPIAAPAPLSCRACPLRHCFAMPPLPKGEALAGRIVSCIFLANYML